MTGETFRDRRRKMESTVQDLLDGGMECIQVRKKILEEKGIDTGKIPSGLKKMIGPMSMDDFLRGYITHPGMMTFWIENGEFIFAGIEESGHFQWDFTFPGQFSGVREVKIICEDPEEDFDSLLNARRTWEKEQIQKAFSDTIDPEIIPAVELRKGEICYSFHTEVMTLRSGLLRYASFLCKGEAVSSEEGSPAVDPVDYYRIDGDKSICPPVTCSVSKNIIVDRKNII